MIFNKMHENTNCIGSVFCFLVVFEVANGCNLESCGLTKSSVITVLVD